METISKDDLKHRAKQKRRFVLYGVMSLILAVILYGAYIVISSVPSRDSVTLSEPVNDSDWSVGPKDAKVTILEYSDLQCPACGFYAPIVDANIKAFASQSVRFVYRHFPLAQHKHARLAATYAESAGRQGKFFEMIKVIFEGQRDWGNSDDPTTIFDKYALNIGLNMSRLGVDLKDPAIAKDIEADLISGTRSGVSSTPSFFINGKAVDFKPNNEFIKNTIESYLR